MNCSAHRGKWYALIAMAIILLSLAHSLSDPAISRAPALSVFPQEIKLPVSGVHRVFVTATDANTAERDVTGKVTFKSNQRDIAEVSKAGVIRGVKPGVAVIEARFKWQTSSVRVTVEPSSADRALSFINDVLPVLSKA